MRKPALLIATIYCTLHGMTCASPNFLGGHQARADACLLRLRWKLSNGADWECTCEMVCTQLALASNGWVRHYCQCQRNQICSKVVLKFCIYAQPVGTTRKSVRTLLVWAGMGKQKEDTNSFDKEYCLRLMAPQHVQVVLRLMAPQHV